MQDDTTVQKLVTFIQVLLYRVWLKCSVCTNLKLAAISLTGHLHQSLLINFVSCQTFVLIFQVNGQDW